MNLARGTSAAVALLCDSKMKEELALKQDSLLANLERRLLNRWIFGGKPNESVKVEEGIIELLIPLPLFLSRFHSFSLLANCTCSRSRGHEERKRVTEWHMI